MVRHHLQGGNFEVPFFAGRFLSTMMNGMHRIITKFPTAAASYLRQHNFPNILHGLQNRRNCSGAAASCADGHVAAHDHFDTLGVDVS